MSVAGANVNFHMMLKELGWTAENHGEVLALLIDALDVVNPDSEAAEQRRDLLRTDFILIQQHRNRP